MENPENQTPPPSPKSRKTTLVVLLVLLIVVLGSAIAYFLWLKPYWETPLADPLDLNTPEAENTLTQAPTEKANIEPPTPTPTVFVSECSDVADWTLLIVGTDFRGSYYLYGLADAIRIAHVDFATPQINVVALPRALLIEDPGPRLDISAPLLLNQTYLFGTEGMGHYQGSGYGAGALAEAIQTNFGVTVDNYVVVNFTAFMNFIDELGGIEVELPAAIGEPEDEIYFPAGKQVLNGEKALQVARNREGSSDNVRIDYQTVILKGIIQQLQRPEILPFFPQLIEAMGDLVLTDITPKQIQSAYCLLDQIDGDRVQFFNPGLDLLEDTRVFIPTMNKEMNVFKWDQNLVDWLDEALWPMPE